MYHYSASVEGKVAKAQAHDQNASYKDLSQVCGAIRGKPVEEAKGLLEECIALKKAIPYRRFNKGCGHRSELGGRRGRYPKKEAKIMLGLVSDAAANARFKGMDEKKLFVASASAYKQTTAKRYRKFWVSGITLGYGKQATWADYVTCRAEVVLAERENNGKKGGRAGGKKTGADKNIETKPAAAKQEIEKQPEKPRQAAETKAEKPAAAKEV